MERRWESNDGGNGVRIDDEMAKSHLRSSSSLHSVSVITHSSSSVKLKSYDRVVRGGGLIPNLDIIPPELGLRLEIAPGLEIEIVVSAMCDLESAFWWL